MQVRRCYNASSKTLRPKIHSANDNGKSDQAKAGSNKVSRVMFDINSPMEWHHGWSSRAHDASQKEIKAAVEEAPKAKSKRRGCCLLCVCMLCCVVCICVGGSAR
jgi:hypothetical protein